MGRAIDMEKNLHALEERVKLVEEALGELIQTRVHHVDLHEEVKHVEPTVIEPDEEFTPPVNTKSKRTTRKAKATATT
jgi:hypothetical protein